MNDDTDFLEEDDYDPEPVYLDKDETDVKRKPEPDDDDDIQIILDEAPPNQQSEKLWYVVHCYSGYENKVRHAIEQRIETMGMRDKIFDVIVPTEEEIEIKDGKRRTVERRVFPGYILVEMRMDEDSWYVVRNTPGVTGFVGMGNDPTPLREDEVKQILNRMSETKPKVNVAYKVGSACASSTAPLTTSSALWPPLMLTRTKCVLWSISLVVTHR
jgi:transcription termination/antitermination protein NusG